MDKFNEAFDKVFAAADKQKAIVDQINAKETELQQLYRDAGKIENFSEYKHVDEKRTAILEEVKSLADQIDNEPDSSEEAKKLWKQYVKAYNETFEKKFAAFVEEQKAIAAQLLSLLEMQREAINRHARCQHILDQGKYDFYGYHLAADEYDLDTPDCLPETMIAEVKALADDGYLPAEKRFGLVKILKKQTTSDNEMNLRYEDLPLSMQAFMYRALNT